MADITRILGAVTTGALLALPIFASAQTRFAWGTRFNSPANDYDYAASASTDKNGNVFVAGSTNSSATGQDFLLAKYSAKGFNSWTKVISHSTTALNGATGSEVARAVDTDSTNSVWVGGEAYLAGGARVAPLYKFNALGVQQVAITIGGTTGSSAAGINALTVLDDDSVLVAGYKNDTGATTGFVNKYDSAGTLLWSKSVAGTDTINGWTLDANGAIFVTGRSTVAGNTDLYTAKLGPDGGTTWLTKYSTDKTDIGLKVALDSAGNVITLGWTDGKSKGIDYVTTKLNSSGVQQWANAWDAQASRKDDIPRNLLVGSDNSVYVTGSTVSGNTYFNTARLSGANGSALNTQRISIGAATATPGLYQLADGSIQLILTTLTNSTPQLSVYTLKNDLSPLDIIRWQLTRASNSVQLTTTATISGVRNVFAIGDNGSTGAGADISIIRVADTPLGLASFTAGKDIPLDVAAALGLQKNNTIVGKGVTATTTAVGEPDSGTVTINADGSFSYVPATDYLGNAFFSYKTVSGAWESDVRTAKVAVAKQRLKLAVVPEKVGTKLVLHVTLSNGSTSVGIPDVVVETALLGSATQPTTTFPITLGLIDKLSSQTFDVAFPGRSAGQKVSVKFTGTFKGDTFSLSTTFTTP